MDPAKLKVTELRAELTARGLDTKGVKAVLVERLRQALEEETGEGKTLNTDFIYILGLAHFHNLYFSDDWKISSHL